MLRNTLGMFRETFLKTKKPLRYHDRLVSLIFCRVGTGVQLRLANNEYKSVSLWERELAKDLALNDGKADRDWVAYLNGLRELFDKRKAEKKQAQRKARKGNSKPSSKVDVSEMSRALEQVSASQDEEYDRYISGFTRPVSAH